MKLNETERTVLSNFVAKPGALKDALEKFAADRRQRMEADCADAMRGVPRAFELAADYASKAEVYKTLMNDLEKFSDEN